MGQIDRVLHDVDLFLEAGLDVDRGVGHQQQPLVARHDHHKHVAYSPRCAEPAVTGNDRPHQLVGV